MTAVFIASLVLGILAPFIRGWIWGAPFSLLSVATALRSFFGSALTVLLLGTVAYFALRATSTPPGQLGLVAALTGATLGLLLLLSSARRMRDLRGLSILCQRLAEEDARPIALAAMDRLLRRVQRKNPQRHVALVLMATGPLTQAGLWGEARDGLLSLDEDSLSEPQLVLRNQALATCELQFDDVKAAQKAIDRIARPTESSIEVWLLAMEALLMAVRGESEQAMAHLGDQNVDENPSLRASHRLVRAHVLASRKEVAAALEELSLLEQEAGRAGLERVVLPRGPASPLAERLLAEGRASQSG